MIRGDRLRKIRKAKGISQQVLADMVGCSKSSISCYEHETRNPSLETILDFMHIFGVSADYLLGSDNFIEVIENEEPKYITLSEEEIMFLDELRKNKLVYNIILEDPKRTAELIKNKIG